MHILTFRASGPYAIRVPGPYASCGPRARIQVAGLGPECYTGPGPVCVASFVVVPFTPWNPELAYRRKNPSEYRKKKGGLISVANLWQSYIIL